MKKIYALKYINNISGKEYFSGNYFVSKKWAEHIAERLENENERIEVVEYTLDDYDPDEE